MISSYIHPRVIQLLFRALVASRDDADLLRELQAAQAKVAELDKTMAARWGGTAVRAHFRI